MYSQPPYFEFELSWGDAHQIFLAESTGINCASVVLNCANITFNCADPQLEIRGVVSEAQPSIIQISEWKWPQLIRFQLCSTLQWVFSNVRAFFPRFGHFLPIFTHKVDATSSSPQTTPIANFRFKIVSINWVSIALNCTTNIFDRARLLSKICASSSTTKIRLPSSPSNCEFQSRNGLNQLGFNCYSSLIWSVK